jgi:hypothetical protein
MTSETDAEAEAGAPTTVERPAVVLVDTDSADGLPPVGHGEGEAAFVVVSLLPRTEQRVAVLEAAHGGPADSVHVVGTEESNPDGYDTVRTVSRPGDLTGLSMRIGEAMSELHGDDICLYFDDVTNLLQYTDLNTAYRFFNVLTGRLRAADAAGFFGVTPGAHDERTVNTLRNLFDDTVGEFP